MDKKILAVFHSLLDGTIRAMEFDTLEDMQRETVGWDKRSIYLVFALRASKDDIIALS